MKYLIKFNNTSQNWLSKLTPVQHFVLLNHLQVRVTDSDQLWPFYIKPQQ